MGENGENNAIRSHFDFHVFTFFFTIAYKLRKRKGFHYDKFVERHAIKIA